MRIIYIFLLSILYSCNSGKYVFENDISSVLKSDTILTLRDWYFIDENHGEWTKNSNPRIEQTKNLKELLDLCVGGTAPSYERIRTSKHMLDIKQYLKFMGKEYTLPASIYMACNIKSPAKAEVILAATVFQFGKVWLNGEHIHSFDFRGGPSKFREEYIPVPLKKGDNYLLIKVEMNMFNHSAMRWQILVDCMNRGYAESMFELDYHRHFLRNSNLSEKDTLKIYTGLHSDKIFDVMISEYSSGKEMEKWLGSADKKTGIIKRESNLPSGLYTCRIEAPGVHFQQTFFQGDIYAYYDSIVKVADSYSDQPLCVKNNLKALAKWSSVNTEPANGDYDDLNEFWNRIRIPALQAFHDVFTCLENGEDPDKLIFLKAYESKLLDTISNYSVHIPKEINYGDEISLFIMLYKSDKPTEWSGHWRNYTSNGLADVIDVCDKNKCVMVWTNCQGENSDKASLIIEEILDDLQKKFVVTRDHTFLLGNCASTQLAYDLFQYQNINDRMGGIGFVNPMPFVADQRFLKMAQDKKVGILCAYNDEEIPFESNLDLFHSIQLPESNVRLIVSKEATHHMNPANYMESLMLWLNR